DLGESCRGRYLPGQRAVVVEHDAAGTERYQLSLLRLDQPGAELEPLVHDEAYIHRLVDVLPGRIVYTTNRRNGVDFDVVTRDLAGAAERVLYDGGGWVDEVAVSPDQRWVVLGRPATPANSTQLVLVDTAAGTLTELTPDDEPARYGRLEWAPDSASFTFATDSGREPAGRRPGVRRGGPVRRGSRERGLPADGRRVGPGRLAVPGRHPDAGGPQRGRRARDHGGRGAAAAAAPRHAAPADRAGVVADRE